MCGETFWENRRGFERKGIPEARYRRALADCTETRVLPILPNTHICILDVDHEAEGVARGLPTVARLHQCACGVEWGYDPHTLAGPGRTSAPGT